MQPRIRLILFTAALLTAALACRLLPGGASPPEPESDPVATSVAATLQARTDPAPEEITSAEPSATPEPETLPLQVVYVLDGDLWFWIEGSEPTALTALGDVLEVALSDDGEVAAFTRRVEAEAVDDLRESLAAVNTDGTGLRALVTAPEFESLTSDPEAISTIVDQLAWVPGTHTLAFSTIETREGPYWPKQHDLHLVDVDSPSLNTLLAPGEAGQFSYHPSGNQIALVQPTSIHVVDADGANRRELHTFPMILTYSEYQYYPALTWTEDGSALRTVIPPRDSLGEPEAGTEIWHLPADGSPGTLLSSVVTIPFFIDPPALSPDGSALAYLAPLPEASEGAELHLSGADGSEDRLYATGELNFDGWSSDGERFIYSQRGRNPKIGRPETAPTEYSGVTLMVDPRWASPERFLYLNRLSGSWELWLGTTSGPETLIGSTTGNPISYDFIP